MVVRLYMYMYLGLYCVFGSIIPRICIHVQGKLMSVFEYIGIDK